MKPRRYSAVDYMVIGLFTILAIPFFVLYIAWDTSKFLYSCLTIQRADK
jgi:hypothetical protein